MILEELAILEELGYWRSWLILEELAILEELV